MSDVQLKIGIDDAGSIRQLNQFRKAAEATIEALKKPVGKVTAFAQLQDTVESTGKSLATAKVRLRDLQQELVRIDSANAKSASTRRVTVCATWATNWPQRPTRRHNFRTSTRRPWRPTRSCSVA
jgi:hypothetical protein